MLSIVDRRAEGDGRPAQDGSGGVGSERLQKKARLDLFDSSGGSTSSHDGKITGHILSLVMPLSLLFRTGCAFHLLSKLPCNQSTFLLHLPTPCPEKVASLLSLTHPRPPPAAATILSHPKPLHRAPPEQGAPTSPPSFHTWPFMLTN